MTSGDPRSVDSADVYKNGRRAATLRRTPHGVAFEYLSDYLNDPQASAVATTLAKSATPFETHSPGAVPSFFAGLLPEGRRLHALRRAVKTSADDEFTLLLEVGADTIGDIQVIASGATIQQQPASLEIDDWATTNFADLYAQLTGESLSFERSGISGVQIKASARMIAMPLKRHGQQCIVKLEPPEFRHLVANEAFFLKAAQECGIRCANATVVHDALGRSALAVERFDRRVDDHGNVDMVAQEDACQVLARYPADKYNVSYEAIGTALSNQTGAPIVAVLDLMRQIAFAYLTGNGDAHAKNFSIGIVDNEWRVTPAYDTPTTLPYRDTTMALRIGGANDERIKRSTFIAFGEQFGVRPKATEGMLDTLLERSHSWFERIDTLPFEDETVNRLRRSIQYRHGRLGSSRAAAPSTRSIVAKAIRAR